MEVTQVDLAWLAGILDGEGNFYINRKHNQNGAEYLDMKIRISSTDMRMIKRVSEIYHALNLRFHFAKVNFNRGTWKNAISINVGTHGSSAKLIGLVYPFLVNKKVIAQIIQKILAFVMSFPQGGNTTRRNYWNAPEMAQLWDAYSVEKDWYFDPSTTTRKANAIFAFDDMV